MRIRQIDPAERAALSLPLQTYAFRPSPVSGGGDESLRRMQPYLAGDLTLVAEDGAGAVAEVSAIPMRQNVRGLVCAMAGIAGVATHPLARRQGHVRVLMDEILGQVRDTGHAVSALHPFRPSFYQRFGYTGLPKPRTVTFSPADLSALLTAELGGEVTVQRVADGYDAYRDFTHRILGQRHGFAVFPDYRAVQLREDNDRWLVTARVGEEVAGMLTYRIRGFDGDLVTDHLLATGARGRALLLRFLAHHVDQIARVVMTVPPDELPELWATDLAAVTEARVALPASPPPMARVLSLEALAGMAVGPGRVAVNVVDDPFIAGQYLLAGTAGTLEVSRAAPPVAKATSAATVTAVGLSGLVYGVLDPDDLVVRGFGTVPDDAAAQLRVLFPRLVPHLPVHF